MKLPSNIHKAQVDNFLKTNRTPHASFPHPTDAGDLCTWGNQIDTVTAATNDEPDDVIEPIPGLDDDDCDDADPDNLLAAEKFDYEGEICECPDFQDMEVRSKILTLAASMVAWSSSSEM